MSFSFTNDRLSKSDSYEGERRAQQTICVFCSAFDLNNITIFGRNSRLPLQKLRRGREENKTYVLSREEQQKRFETHTQTKQTSSYSDGSSFPTVISPLARHTPKAKKKEKKVDGIHRNERCCCRLLHCLVNLCAI